MHLTFEMCSVYLTAIFLHISMLYSVYSLYLCLVDLMQDFLRIRQLLTHISLKSVYITEQKMCHV